MLSPHRIALIGGAAAFALCCASSVVAKTASAAGDGIGAAAAADAGYGHEDAPGGPGGGPDHGGHWGGDMHHRGGDPERMARHLRDVLQLTPNQEPALQAFLTAMHPAHPPGPGGDHARGPAPADPAARKAEMDKRMAEMKGRRDEMEKKRAAEAALTTPQRLDEMVKHMQDRMAKRQTEMQAHIAAIKQFYAALTPSQQKAFDALHGGMMHGGMGQGRGHGGWEHGGMRFGMMDEPMPPMPPLPPMPPRLAMRAPMPPLPPLPPTPPAPPAPPAAPY